MLLDELRQRILILDGAIGTMIQEHSLREEDFRCEAFAECTKELKGDNECLNITRPDIILDIHRAYIKAGADIITTNSFSANSISQAEYGLESRANEMAREAARLARRAADEAASAPSARKVWVAGSVGPTSKSLSLASDISDPDFRLYDFNAMYKAYREQIAALLEGGVDIILLETCFDALNAKAAIAAISDLGTDTPVMVSVSVGDKSGRTLTGQTLEAFYHSVKHANLLSFGINCSLGAKDMEPLLNDVSSFTKCRVSCHPNAGLPDEMGRYNDSPRFMADTLQRMAQDGCLNIAGGCCGTTPKHIEAIAQALKGIAPRPLPQQDHILRVSGLESTEIDRRNNFTNIGERTNVAGSRKFAKLIASGDYDAALQIAADQIENGAGIIDINMDDAMLDSRLQMRRFLRCISNDPAVAKAAIMIDSSHWDTIVEGLKNAQGKCIVNSISLKEGEESMIEKAGFIKKMGAATVVMAFDEEGQATTYERKIEICKRAYDILTRKVGMLPQDIIFDANVLSVGTGIAEHRRYGIDFIEAVRWIKGNLPHALCSGGISNLSFAFRGNNTVREAMHSAFLYHASKAGLDMGIVNPGMLQIYDEIEPDMLRKVEDVILDRNDGATDALIEKAQELATGAISGAGESSAHEAHGANGAHSEGASAGGTTPAVLTAEDRIINALVKGVSTTLKNDLMDCLERYGRAVDVIEGPLMDGMRKVGEYFGEGKMFLPQVVKSAKTMRDAVELLRPFMDASDSGQKINRPRIVIATVKGDVHDIGKNITATVLGCNGFEVIDLGVMVPKEAILEAAEQYNADIIAVSGLITPSLFQMEELCREMAKRGMETPLFIGGATTSAIHTAVKLAPLYNHVYYGADASATAVLCKSYLANPDSFEKEQQAKQLQLREQYSSKAPEKTGHGTKTFDAESFIRGNVFSNIPAGEIPASEVLPYFDWRMFNAVWGIKWEDAQLKNDAKSAMEKHIAHGHLHIKLGLQFHPAHSSGDIIILSNGTQIPMLRQEQSPCLSLADFLPDESLGFDSQIGFMMISVTSDGECPCCRSEYDSMMLRAIKVCLAEAVSEYVSAKMEKELASSSDSVHEGVKIIKPAAGYSSCPDHSLKREIMAAIPSAERLGISFTETYAMIPEASICAFVFAHPQAVYPEIRQISEKKLDAYSELRAFNTQEKNTFLGHLKTYAD